MPIDMNSLLSNNSGIYSDANRNGILDDGDEIVVNVTDSVDYIRKLQEDFNADPTKLKQTIFIKSKDEAVYYKIEFVRSETLRDKQQIKPSQSIIIDNITFTVGDCETILSLELLEKMAKFINGLPKRLGTPDLQIPTFSFTKDGRSSAARSGGGITLNPAEFLAGYFEPAVTHEMAHKVYNKLYAESLSPESIPLRIKSQPVDYETMVSAAKASYKDQKPSGPWGRVYALAMYTGAYQWVDDSNDAYEPMLDNARGHPYDAPTELFASSMSAIINFPEQFSEIIKQRTGEERVVLLMIWCFLRDEIGVSIANDPFKDFTMNSLESGAELPAMMKKYMDSDTQPLNKSFFGV